MARKSEKVELRVTPEFKARLKSEAGDVPVARFVTKVLEKALGPSSESSAPDVVETTGGRGSSRPAPSRAPEWNEPPPLRKEAAESLGRERSYAKPFVPLPKGKS